MEQVIGLLKNNFSETETSGISMVLFLVAFLYLLCTKNKERRGWLVFIALLLVLVLNPFSYNNITTFWFFDDYWKLFFTLMPTIIVAYAFTVLIVEIKEKWLKCLMLLSCIFLIAFSERFSFEPVKAAVPETTDGVSEELIELDAILCSAEVPVSNVIAPRNVIAHIREIDADVTLLYSEELIQRMIEKSYADEDEEYVQYIEHCASVVSAPDAVDNQINVAERYGSNCIILDTENDDAVLMSQRGFARLGVTENYVVYVKDAYED